MSEFLIALAGLGRDARLTLGLMGLDGLHLRVLATSSEDENERRNAARGVHQSRDNWAVGNI